MTAGTSIRRLVEAGLHLMSEGAPGQAMHEFAKLKQIAERFRRYEANCREKAIAARDERRAARMLAHADRWRRGAERVEKAADDSRVRAPPQAP